MHSRCQSCVEQFVNNAGGGALLQPPDVIMQLPPAFLLFDFSPVCVFKCSVLSCLSIMQEEALQPPDVIMQVWVLECRGIPPVW